MNSLEIIETLFKLGLKSNNLGFSCLYEMILYSHITNQKIEEEFYYLLILKFQKSGKQIERAISYALYQVKAKNDPLYTELLANQEPTIFNLIESICKKLECD